MQISSILFYSFSLCSIIFITIILLPLSTVTLKKRSYSALLLP
ncbi:hypothetical protein HMPREF0971_00222 [Segatella oris F0302]|uniref:Uncharacterized protein n=1 Tax=Segatella oris F0302 TaxID=649760 RepID=D1QMI9_9BACT|nr:hypothetical protein HMPREF0971_00222 [Segatella oris F0302]